MMNIETENIAVLSHQLLQLCIERKIKIVTAESCTGGLLSAAITSVPNASQIFENGFITYSNEAKTEMLNVPTKLLGTYGAVSAQVAEAMAIGALDHSNAHAAVSITGIAGPGGGTPEKPVGLVYIGFAHRSGIESKAYDFGGMEREAVRYAATQMALRGLLDFIPRSDLLAAGASLR